MAPVLVPYDDEEDDRPTPSYADSPVRAAPEDDDDINGGASDDDGDDDADDPIPDGAEASVAAEDDSDVHSAEDGSDVHAPLAEDDSDAPAEHAGAPVGEVGVPGEDGEHHRVGAGFGSDDDDDDDDDDAAAAAARGEDDDDGARPASILESARAAKRRRVATDDEADGAARARALPSASELFDDGAEGVGEWQQRAAWLEAPVDLTRHAGARGAAPAGAAAARAVDDESDERLPGVARAPSPPSPGGFDTYQHYDYRRGWSGRSAHNIQG